MNNTLSSYFGLTLLASIVVLSGLNGYLGDYFQFNILSSYIIVFFGLCLITFTMSQIAEMVCSAKFVFFKASDAKPELLFNIGIAIKYSYTASFSWILGYVGNGFLFSNDSLSTSAVADIAVSLLYGFIVSELILRPIYNKLYSINKQ